ncbi:hypothetical protein ACIHCQ_39125 [Streptomyces sp. NPDC052236]|uniref:hypothetical protein n=1 Tax=Streptomyces sp. NPDC052236 TaxID=3365686 RepID=UPI0037D530F6
MSGEPPQNAADSITVGIEYPAFQAMLKHVAGCQFCAEGGGECVTFRVLVKTLREATGKDT